MENLVINLSIFFVLVLVSKIFLLKSPGTGQNTKKSVLFMGNSRVGGRLRLKHCRDE